MSDLVERLRSFAGLRGEAADEIERLRAAHDALLAFAHWAITTGPWEGGHLDGGDVQEKAAELGLIIKTQYDPAVHGENCEVDPGDNWYVFAKGGEP